MSERPARSSSTIIASVVGVLAILTLTSQCGRMQQQRKQKREEQQLQQLEIAVRANAVGNVRSQLGDETVQLLRSTLSWADLGIAVQVNGALEQTVNGEKQKRFFKLRMRKSTLSRGAPWWKVEEFETRDERFESLRKRLR